MLFKSGLFLALFAVVLASPVFQEYPAEVNHDVDEYVPLEEVVYVPVLRVRREVEVNPHVTKQDGTTNAGVSVTQRGKQHEVTGYWNRNIQGPGRGRPNYGIRGSYKF